MIEYIKIKWFKCFQEEEFKFSSWINLLVWENDAGKSTVLEAIKIFSGQIIVDDEMITNWETFTEIEISKDSIIFSCEKTKWEAVKFYKIIDLKNIKERLDEEKLDVDQLKTILSELWESQTWVTTLQSKTRKFNEYVEWKNLETNPKEKKEIPYWLVFKEFQNLKYEDWKQFNNIQDNFKNFIKDSVNTIWSTEIELNWWENKTLTDIIAKSLKRIKDDKESEYKDKVLPTIKGIIPYVDNIKINLSPNLWNFNSYESKIWIIWIDWEEVNFDKKWDWTKRRITLALFKVESCSTDWNKIFLMDEPDTHLNLRVQQDLLKMFDNLKDQWHQIIFTTHSPFILNLVPISKTSLIKNNGIYSNKIDMDVTNPDEFEQTLYALWIQNIDVFFSKYFLFFEWDTEKEFFSKMYYKTKGISIERKFVRQIICEWISNEAIFMQNFIRIIWDNIKMIWVVDSDYTDNNKTKDVINSIEWKYNPLWNFVLFKLWTKEFEDLFVPEDLFGCFWNILSSKMDLSTFKERFHSSKKKSEYLCGVLWLWKPEIWRKLAEYFHYDYLHQSLKNIIDYINLL